MNTDNPYESPQADAGVPDYMQFGNARDLTWSEILFSFTGRIPRRVFWGASIGIVFVFFVVLIAVMLILGQDSDITSVVNFLLYIPMLWVSLAVQVKRWHDRDKSGAWVLIQIIPIVGGIWAFIETFCLRGTTGGNQYGPDPT